MLLLSLLINIAYCTIVGIDLGSDSIKVAVGSRYKPVHLVKNIHSHEATPNIFAYKDKAHWSFGEDAIDQCLLHPEKCIQNQNLPLNSNEYFETNPLKGYEIVALFLKQILKNVKESEAIEDDMKVVIAIPPSMTIREKSYLQNALTVAGINCIQFVTSTFAPIELYVNEKKYGSRTDNSAVFIDIGHGGVRVSGFEFDQTKIVQKFGLYDDKIGGKTIDENLLNLVINKYKIKMPTDNIEYSKNRLALLADIRKAREKLTVNPTGISFEFKSKTITITRKDIDDCSYEIKQALNQMIESLKQNNPNLLMSGCIQLLGGCSRIPCLQEHIKKLLPNFRLLKTIDVASAVCMGACYRINDEIPTKIQVHESLFTSEIIMETYENAYRIFSSEKAESFNPVVRLNNYEQQQYVTLIDKNDENREFMRFSINTPRFNYFNAYYYSTINLDFSLNNFLIPVPNKPLLIQQNRRQVPLSISYDNVGWEVSSDELAKSKNVINSMMKAVQKRLIVEKHLNSIDAYKIYVQRKLKSYGFLNWRNFAFSGICSYIDARCKSCLEQNKIECSDEKINSILYDFKALVKFVLKINESNDDKGERSDRINAIEELNDLLEVCKIAGVSFDDVKKWYNDNLKKASLEEINEQIHKLKERGKTSLKLIL